MNIFFVVPYVPNLIRVRPYNLIKFLARAGHKVSLLTVYSSGEELSDIKLLEPFCEDVHTLHQSKFRTLWNCLLAVPKGEPLQAVYSWNPELARQLPSLTGGSNGNRPVDILHVEHLRGARYGLVSLGSGVDQNQHRIGRRPIVWDSVDCISHLFRQAAGQSKRATSRLITRFELPRTERFERSLLRKFDRILVTSAADREALLKLDRGEGAAHPISVVTNGVDLDYFRPDPAVSRETRSLVLSGKMSYHANVSMAVYMVQEVMPVVWGKFPDVRIDIVGKDPSPEVLRLASDPRVKVTGTVRDIRTYLNKASIAVSPIVYGAGIQNKILEAMATETPVVTTAAGASALQAKIGRDLLVGDSPDSIGVLIHELLSDPTRAHEIAVSGRAYVEANHHWPSIVDKLVQVYFETIELRDPTRKVAESLSV